MRFVMFFYCNMCHASEGSANLIDSINFRNLSGNSSRKTFSKHILGNYENLGVFSLLKFIQIILKIFLRVLETPDSSVQLEITPAVPSAILLELPSSKNSSSSPSAILPEVLSGISPGVPPEILPEDASGLPCKSSVTNSFQNFCRDSLTGSFEKSFGNPS